MEILGPALEVGNKMWKPISRRFKYYRDLHKNMDVLRGKLEELNCRKEDIRLRIRGQLHEGKMAKKEVELWMQNVDKANDEAQILEQKVGRAKYLSRARLGKSVLKQIEEVEELHRKGASADDLVVDAPQRHGIMLPTTKIIGESTAERKMEEIWECLLSDDVTKVGLYGMGGAGKTTIMKHINNKLLQQRDKFDHVIWITVSKDFNVSRLQHDIAKALKLDLSMHEDETMRAANLDAELRKTKRYVIILDDIWKAFRFEDVGIPEPDQANGCKLVLTTRLRDVCKRMGCIGIKMDLPTQEEAWELFLDQVGRDTLLTSNLDMSIVKEVVKECACLPLALITVAGSMKGVVDLAEWRNALQELRKHGNWANMEEGAVYDKLIFSYDRLKDKNLQRCLLYCALHPEDSWIEEIELIGHMIAQGFITGDTWQAKQDMGCTMLNKLENACLLESRYDVLAQPVRHVKMHDVIRDMALKIMNEPTRVMVEGGLLFGWGLKEVLSEEKWTENLEIVSLMNHRFSDITLDLSSPRYNISTLLLSGNLFLSRIADSFFNHMPSLRVLDMSYTAIKELPNAISNLGNLEALLLRQCTNLSCVPPLGKNLALKMLDLSFSLLEEVPQGLEMLGNLQYLNLCNKCLKMIPTGILPRLWSLEYLVLNLWSHLRVKGEQLVALKNLESVACQFYDFHGFNRYLRYLIESQEERRL